MKKRQYTSPLTEVVQFGSDIIMQVFGPASMPDDKFKDAPRHRTKVF